MPTNDAHMELRWNFGLGTPPEAADWCASERTYYLNIFVPDATHPGPFDANVPPPWPPNHTDEPLQMPMPWVGTRKIDAPSSLWFWVGFYADDSFGGRFRASKAFQAENNLLVLFETSDLVDIGSDQNR